MVRLEVMKRMMSLEYYIQVILLEHIGGPMATMGHVLSWLKGASESFRRKVFSNRAESSQNLPRAPSASARYSQTPKRYSLAFTR